MKLLKKLLITIIVLVVLIIGAFFGGVYYLNKKYDIDTLKTLSSLKKLSEPVEEKDVVSNPYTDADKESLEKNFETSFSGFISSDKDGIHINPDKVLEGERKNVYITDRQLAAFASEALEEKTGSKIQIADYTFPLQILELNIADMTEKNATISTVVRLDVSELKTSFTQFPLSLFGKYIPTYFYLNVAFENVHLDDAFSYRVNPGDVKINSLTDTESSDLFVTIGKFVSFPTVEECSKQVGSTFMDNLIGSEENPGAIRQLKQYGAKDYAFVEHEKQGCLAVICNPLSFAI